MGSTPTPGTMCNNAHNNTESEREMQDTTYATVTRWAEYRTPSGRWSKVQHFKGESVYTPHNLSHFFSIHFPGEQRQYAYFAQGYLPRRVTVPSPDGTQRRVYTFDYHTGPREITKHEHESENNDVA